MKINSSSVIVFVLLVVAGCGEQSQAESGSESSGRSTYQPGSWIHNDYQAASTAAAELDVPILIDLYADWCRPCHMLADDYFGSEEMKPLLDKMVLLRIDIDTPDGQVHARTFEVAAIPTVVVALSDGSEVDKIIGVIGNVEEYNSALEVIYTRAVSQL